MGGTGVAVEKDVYPATSKYKQTGVIFYAGLFPRHIFVQTRQW